ncbi:MAG: hypothetical protein ACLQNE_09910 [Thermoguttaceae bacterium]
MSSTRSRTVGSPEVPDVGTLALDIARSGSASVQGRSSAAHPHLPRDPLENLLRALAVAGQVTVVKVGGERVYRATM